MASANSVLNVARSQLGYKSSSTWSKYNQWYGMGGYWCAMFVSWVAWQAGAASIIPRHAWTPSGAQWFIDRGRWHRGASGLCPGDIVFFRFGGSTIDHVGIFEGWKNGMVVTIDGNTGSSGGRTGGCVLRRVRSSGYVAGYGRPAYSGTSSASGGIAVDGYWGAETTRALQRRYGTPVDGCVSGQVHKPEACPAWRLGGGGSTLVKAMQRRYGTSPDGLFGPDTTRAAQRYHGTPVDGVISPHGQSSLIRAIQRELNG